MIATIDTEFGKIEVARQSDGTGTAYFYRDDHEASINAQGEFTNTWGTPFRVHWDLLKTKRIVLEAFMPRTIGAVNL